MGKTPEAVLARAIAGLQAEMRDVRAALLNRVRLDDTGWLDPTLLNSWEQYDAAGGHLRARYRLRAGLVHIQGLVKLGTTTVGTPIFNVPAGMRPSGILVGTQASAGGFARVDIEPDGDVVVIECSNNAYLSVNFPPFPPDQ